MQIEVFGSMCVSESGEEQTERQSREPMTGVGK